MEILLGVDGRDYRMQAWVIMPNHSYLVVSVSDVPLAKLVHVSSRLPSQRGESALERNVQSVVE